MRLHNRCLFGIALCAFTMPSFGQSVYQAEAADADRRAKVLLDLSPGLVASPSRILVKFRSSAGEPARSSARQSVGAVLLHRFGLVRGLELVDSSQGASKAVLALRRNPNVLYAEPDYVLAALASPNDPQLSKEWGLGSAGQYGINTPLAWSLHTGGPAFAIAVLDTGMQVDHVDLAPNLYRNPNEVGGNGMDDDGNGYIDDVNGWNFYDNTNDPSDLHGHGTHTAGTIGAVGNNGIGVTGVNWACKLMPLKFIGPNGGYTSDAIRAIEYAVRQGVRVSNNSWGGSVADQALRDAIVAAGNAGHLFVAAAGNSAGNSDVNPLYPAAYDSPNIISVAAIDMNGGLAYFSNFGAASVDLAAPGDQVYSTYIGNTLTYMSGTSMAAPHVAGVVALTWSYHADWTGNQVRDRVLSRTRTLASLTGKCVTGGMVDAYASLSDEAAPPAVAISSPGNNKVFVQGVLLTLSGSATDGVDGDISSAIEWTSNKDGFLGSGSALGVRDLTAGFQTLTASVVDSRGLTASSSVTIYVENSAASISVASPSNGGSAAEGATVTFSASASDVQDGDVTSRLVWTSSIQGQLGTGGSFSRSDLIAGTHSITISVVDSGNLRSSVSISLSVGDVAVPAPTPESPSAPSSPSLVKSNGGLRLGWVDTSGNEEWFEIERQYRIGKKWSTAVRVGTASANSTSLLDSPPSGTWHYRVRSANAAGCSQWSAWSNTVKL